MYCPIALSYDYVSANQISRSSKLVSFENSKLNSFILATKHLTVRDFEFAILTSLL